MTLGGTSCVGWKLFCGDERVAIVENTGFGLSFQSEGGGYRFNWNGYFHAGKGSAPLTADNLLERLPDVDDITEGQAQALADMLKAAVEMRNRGNPWLPNWRLKQMSPMLADSYLWRRFVADMASELPDTQRFWAAYTAKWFGR
ncbi:MAG: hypothetical protein LBR32_04160 [Propionibacteriaceae bacterium]|nr:hypothetical protein [Propionibacteriaceae bacterium]